MVATKSSVNWAVTALCLLIAPLARVAVGQIQIDASEFVRLAPRAFSSTVWAVDASGFPALQVMYDQRGPDQTYDFTGVATRSSSTVIIDVLTSSTATPAADDPFFASANRVTAQDLVGAEGRSWTFWSLTQDGFSQLGTILITDSNGDGVADSTIIRNQPANRFLSLPLRFGTGWVESYLQTVTVGDNVNESVKDDTAAVDGWGQLITPLGTVEVLRLWESQSTTLDVGGGTMIRSTFNLVSFYSEGAISATILANENGDVVAGSFAATEEVPPTSGREPALGERLVALGQPYPNPSAGTVTIPYVLDVPAHVRLSVTDVLGREVDVLVARRMPAGNHTVQWNRRGLAIGVYIAHLAGSRFHEFRKVTFVQ